MAASRCAGGHTATPRAELSPGISDDDQGTRVRRIGTVLLWVIATLALAVAIPAVRSLAPINRQLVSQGQ